jgi:hypothetical protein
MALTNSTSYLPKAYLSKSQKYISDTPKRHFWQLYLYTIDYSEGISLAIGMPKLLCNSTNQNTENIWWKEKKVVTLQPICKLSTEF